MWPKRRAAHPGVGHAQQTLQHGYGRLAHRAHYVQHVVQHLAAALIHQLAERRQDELRVGVQIDQGPRGQVPHPRLAASQGIQQRGNGPLPAMFILGIDASQGPDAHGVQQRGGRSGEFPQAVVGRAGLGADAPQGEDGRQPHPRIDVAQGLSQQGHGVGGGRPDGSQGQDHLAADFAVMFAFQEVRQRGDRRGRVRTDLTQGQANVAGRFVVAQRSA